MHNTGLIFVLRHCRIETGKDRRFIGQTDLPLNKEGLRQAAGLREILSIFPFDEVYSGTLQRSLETAKLVLPDRKVRAEPCLNEIHLGNWENKRFETIRKNRPRDFSARGRHLDTYRPPGGESFADLSSRVLPFFLHINHQRQTHTMVVTHAGVIRVLLSYIHNTPLADLFQYRPGYGELLIFGPRETCDKKTIQ